MGAPDGDVRSLMTPGVISCRADALLGDVARQLAEHRVRAIFVLDDGDRPLGVISDFDLLAGEWLGSDATSIDAIRRMTAAELMSAPVASIRADAQIAEAAARLDELGIGRLLVCEGAGRAVGVISLSDLIAAWAESGPARHQVGDVMSHAILTCHPRAPIGAALRGMKERRSRSIVVADDGRPQGVLTAHDFLRAYERSVELPLDAPVSEVMTTPVISATPGLPLPEAASRMLDHEIHRLVVTDDDGVLLGVVSTYDIVLEMADARSVWQTDVAVRDD